MKFILTSGWEDGVADLTERLVRELAGGQRVLWLTSGGSNVPSSIQIMANIPPKLKSNLTVMPVDERYGAIGHDESNWQQLMDASFEAGQATLLPVLADGLDLQATKARYEQQTAEAFKNNDLVIAQLGIGGDGHLAGILPDSEAATGTDELVAAYQSKPFERLTLTFAALRQISAAYVFAFGNTKHEALTALHDQSIEPAKQPAQILKQMPEAYVYSDQVGEHV